MMTAVLDEQDIMAAARDRGWQLVPATAASVQRELARFLDHAAIVESFVIAMPHRDGPGNDR